MRTGCIGMCLQGRLFALARRLPRRAKAGRCLRTNTLVGLSPSATAGCVGNEAVAHREQAGDNAEHVC